ncbi:MAG TPA: 4Fe-4S binding protein, partial [Terriglobales bacterium]
MSLTRRHFLVLLPAAAIAWDSIIAGTPGAAPNYNLTDHWWGMLIDVTKCIGCGTCVQALHSGLPLWLPLPEPRNQHRFEVHAVLPPHRPGANHSVLRKLSHRHSPA